MWTLRNKVFHVFEISRYYTPVCIRKASHSTETWFENEFNKDETRVILDKINYETEDQLSAYTSLNAKKIRQIIECRNSKPFEKISDMLDLKGFGKKRIIYLGQSMLLEKTNRGSTSFYIGKNQISPCFEASEKPGSVLSVSINSKNFGWLHMDSNYCVNAWEYQQMWSEFKYNHRKCQEKILDFVRILPDSDLYLMEDFTPKILNSSNFSSILNQARLETMTTATLNIFNVTDYMKPKVYKIKSSTISKHFQLNIGGERVSSLNLVKKIYYQEYENLNVKIKAGAMKQYLNADTVQQESMASCLLQSVLFYQFLNSNTENTCLEATVKDENNL